MSRLRAMETVAMMALEQATASVSQKMSGALYMTVAARMAGRQARITFVRDGVGEAEAALTVSGFTGQIWYAEMPCEGTREDWSHMDLYMDLDDPAKTPPVVLFAVSRFLAAAIDLHRDAMSGRAAVTR